MKTRALAAAFVTTLLWSGSYIVNKIAFAQGAGPLTLAGVRYLLAALALGAVLKKTADGAPLPLPMALLQGLVCFGLGQGCQYVGQRLLTPTMASLLLNAGMVLFIVAADRLRLRESPGVSLYWKIALLIFGMAAYYAPWNGALELPAAGVAFMLLAAFGSAMNVALNRYMLAVRGIERRSLTIRPMGCGGAMMLLAGLLSEPLPRVTWRLALCVVYLAFLSGAMGFSLWVWSQQHLTAVQSGGINNAMLIEIAALDVLCFGRVLTRWQWLGIGVVFAAITLLQMRAPAGRAQARA